MSISASASASPTESPRASSSKSSSTTASSSSSAAAYSSLRSRRAAARAARDAEESAATLASSAHGTISLLPPAQQLDLLDSLSPHSSTTQFINSLSQRISTVLEFTPEHVQTFLMRHDVSCLIHEFTEMRHASWNTHHKRDEATTNGSRMGMHHHSRNVSNSSIGSVGSNSGGTGGAGGLAASASSSSISVPFHRRSFSHSRSNQEGDTTGGAIAAPASPSTASFLTSALDAVSARRTPSPVPPSIISAISPSSASSRRGGRLANGAGSRRPSVQRSSMIGPDAMSALHAKASQNDPAEKLKELRRSVQAERAQRAKMGIPEEVMDWKLTNRLVFYRAQADPTATATSTSTTSTNNPPLSPRLDMMHSIVREEEKQQISDLNTTSDNSTESKSNSSSSNPSSTTTATSDITVSSSELHLYTGSDLHVTSGLVCIVFTRLPRLDAAASDITTELSTQNTEVVCTIGQLGVASDVNEVASREQAQQNAMILQSLLQMTQAFLPAVTQQEMSEGISNSTAASSSIAASSHWSTLKQSGLSSGSAVQAVKALRSNTSISNDAPSSTVSSSSQHPFSSLSTPPSTSSLTGSSTLTSFSTLLSSTHSSLTSLNTLYLEAPLSKYSVPSLSADIQTLYSLCAQRDRIEYYEKLVNGWCSVINTHLSANSALRNSSAYEAGGCEAELSYWKSRHTLYSHILQQSTLLHVQSILNILRLYKSRYITLWQNVYSKCVEIVQESQDTIQYLCVLNASCQSLYSVQATPSDITQSLPSIMRGIVSVYTLSKYYNTTEDMTILFVKITNQIVKQCRRFLVSSGGGSGSSTGRTSGIDSSSNTSIWKRDRLTALHQLNSVISCCNAYYQLYLQTKDELARGSGSAGGGLTGTNSALQFNFSQHSIFSNLHSFLHRCSQVHSMLSTLLQFQSISHAAVSQDQEERIEGLDDVEKMVRDLVRETMTYGVMNSTDSGSVIVPAAAPTASSTSSGSTATPSTTTTSTSATAAASSAADDAMDFFSSTKEQYDLFDYTSSHFKEDFMSFQKAAKSVEEGVVQVMNREFDALQVQQHQQQKKVHQHNVPVEQQLEESSSSSSPATPSTNAAITRGGETMRLIRLFTSFRKMFEKNSMLEGAPSSTSSQSTSSSSSSSSLTLGSRSSLLSVLFTKRQLLLTSYQLDLLSLRSQYELCKKDPSSFMQENREKNLPPVTNAIQWCRQLMRRVVEPMKVLVKEGILEMAEQQQRVRRVSDASDSSIPPPANPPTLLTTPSTSVNSRRPSRGEISPPSVTTVGTSTTTTTTTTSTTASPSLAPGSNSLPTPPSASKVIRLYNSLISAFSQYETMWYRTWLESVPVVMKEMSGMALLKVVQGGSEGGESIIQLSNHRATPPLPPTFLPHPSSSTNIVHMPHLALNFSPTLHILFREAICLRKLGMRDVPLSLLQTQNKLSSLQTSLTTLLESYNFLSCRMISPIYSGLLYPRLQRMWEKIYPGLSEKQMSWISSQQLIESYINTINNELTSLSTLLLKLNDLIEIRIMKDGLEFINQTDLFSHVPASSSSTSSPLSSSRTISPPTPVLQTIQDFYTSTKSSIDSLIPILNSRVYQVELSCYEMISLITSNYSREEKRSVRTMKRGVIQHVYSLVFYSIRMMIEKNFMKLKEIFSGSGSSGGAGANSSNAANSSPLFSLTLSLHRIRSSTSDKKELRLVPSLDELQSFMNKTARAILAVTNGIVVPGQIRDADSNSAHPPLETYYPIIGKDPHILRLVFQLTGMFVSLRRKVTHYLTAFQPYSFLWTENKQDVLQRFIEDGDPSLEEYEEQIEKFHEYEMKLVKMAEEGGDRGVTSSVVGANGTDGGTTVTTSSPNTSTNINTFSSLPSYRISSLLISHTQFYSSLHAEILEWKHLYGYHLNSLAVESCRSITTTLSSSITSLSQPISSLSELMTRTHDLTAIKSQEETSDILLQPIQDIWRTMKKYKIHSVEDEKEELSKLQTLQTSWTTLHTLINTTQSTILSHRHTYEKDYLSLLVQFKADLTLFESYYQREGPFLLGISPKLACERLDHFQAEYDMRFKKYQFYCELELLFFGSKYRGKYTSCPFLLRIGRELVLGQSMYSIYKELMEFHEKFVETEWKVVCGSGNTMNEKKVLSSSKDEKEEKKDGNNTTTSSSFSTLSSIEAEMLRFTTRCSSLPRGIKDWLAYREIKTLLHIWGECMPLLMKLQAQSIQERHWTQLMIWINGVTTDGSGNIMNKRTSATTILAVTEVKSNNKGVGINNTSTLNKRGSLNTLRQLKMSPRSGGGVSINTTVTTDPMTSPIQSPLSSPKSSSFISPAQPLLTLSTLRLKHLLSPTFLSHKDEIEELCFHAHKESEISTKFAQLQTSWKEEVFRWEKQRGGGGGGGGGGNKSSQKSTSNSMTTTVTTSTIPIPSRSRHRHRKLLLSSKHSLYLTTKCTETQLLLNSLLNSRYNGFCKVALLQWAGFMSQIAEILEEWLSVQNLYIYISTVFTSGDVSKQLPEESARFHEIDEKWYEMMCEVMKEGRVMKVCCENTHVAEEKNGMRNSNSSKKNSNVSILAALMNDGNNKLHYEQQQQSITISSPAPDVRHLSLLLPWMRTNLEICQKQLSGYLEQKRLIFPRFYFISDPVLLEILGRGSDATHIQPYLYSIFDNIQTIELKHDEARDRELLEERQQLAARRGSGGVGGGGGMNELMDDEEGDDDEYYEEDEEDGEGGDTTSSSHRTSTTSSSSSRYPSSYIVTSMISPEGEKVKLRESIACRGNIESWLIQLEQESHETIRRICSVSLAQCEGTAGTSSSTSAASGTSMFDFIRKFPSQCVLLTYQILWTRGSEEGLRGCKKDRNSMMLQLKSMIELLKNFVALTNNPKLSDLIRSTVETLITVQVHQRDVYERLIKMKIRSLNDFDWLKQTRYYWVWNKSYCQISITDVDFIYGNEYVGIGRLVITPLTDRCYITLAQALGLGLGGSPVGPAGTGKTETVKDMGRTLGKFVVVFNCSDQMDYLQLAKIFKGVALSGVWSDFDEFNRIKLEVLSVVAQQISCVLSAIREYRTTATFTDGSLITVDPTCGIFVTMNPGYAGRQELPENLKALFRNVSMMVPERAVIIQVKLAASGFYRNVVLSKKFTLLYHLCEQQLSKQRHYDFGLRNILSVLRVLGPAKRADPTRTEEDIFTSVLRDMNVSKLIDTDEILFLALLEDVFPKQNTVQKKSVEAIQFDTLIQEYCDAKNLIPHPNWTRKIIELNQLLSVRHGVMILGPTAGKSSALEGLRYALGKIDCERTVRRMNPKAITAAQMFGRLDESTQDWTEGIFSELWRAASAPAQVNAPQTKPWIILDGPVDTLWVESLNSVLDDSRVLTLANGDRLGMPKDMRLIFEVADLTNASPATVSRAGMIYMSTSTLHWTAIVEAWMNRRCGEKKIAGESTSDDSILQQHHTRAFNSDSTNTITNSSSLHLCPSDASLVSSLLSRLLPLIFTWFRTTGIQSVMQLTELSRVQTVLNYIDGLLEARPKWTKEEEKEEEGWTGEEDQDGSVSDSTTPSTAGGGVAPTRRISVNGSSNKQRNVAVAPPLTSKSSRPQQYLDTVATSSNMTTTNPPSPSSLLSPSSSSPNISPRYRRHSALHRIILFSVAWGLGGLLSHADRMRFHTFLKEEGKLRVPYQIVKMNAEGAEKKYVTDVPLVQVVGNKKDAVNSSQGLSPDDTIFSYHLSLTSPATFSWCHWSSLVTRWSYLEKLDRFRQARMKAEDEEIEKDAGSGIGIGDPQAARKAVKTMEVMMGGGRDGGMMSSDDEEMDEESDQHLLNSTSATASSLLDFESSPLLTRWFSSPPLSPLISSKLSVPSYSSIFIPTMDSVRAEYTMSLIAKQLEKSILIVGEMGSAKTVTALRFLEMMCSASSSNGQQQQQQMSRAGRRASLLSSHSTTSAYTSQQSQPHLQHTSKSISFSSATTPGVFQTILESCLVKRATGVYGPPTSTAGTNGDTTVAAVESGENGVKSNVAKGKKKSTGTTDSSPLPSSTTTTSTSSSSISSRYTPTRLTLFIDDLNMPSINSWGDQVTNEIVRQVMEYHQVYSLVKPGELMSIQDVNIMAAMNLPYGGRNDIPNRLKGRFHIIYLTSPSRESLERIYSAIVRGYFNAEHGFQQESLIALSRILPKLTYTLWSSVQRTLLPTPTKSHYLFNIRDVSKIFEGVCVNSNPSLIKNELTLMNLWLCETQRVLSDKLINAADVEWLNHELVRTIENVCPMSVWGQKGWREGLFVQMGKQNSGNSTTNATTSIQANDTPKYFIHFLHALDGQEEDLNAALQANTHNNDDSKISADTSLTTEVISSSSSTSTAQFSMDELARQQEEAARYALLQSKNSVLKLSTYEPSPSFSVLKRLLNHYLMNYNAQQRIEPMSLVFFPDAISHLLRICRILHTKNKGHAMLVGIGGCGKQSLTRLAAYVNQSKLVTPSLVNNLSDFLELLKTLYVDAGIHGKSVTFLLTDNDIKDSYESIYLEYINMILTTGEISGLFSRDEINNMMYELRANMEREYEVEERELGVWESQAVEQQQQEKQQKSVNGGSGGRKAAVSSVIPTDDDLSTSSSGGNSSSSSSSTSSIDYYTEFLIRVRSNLHIILCFSPLHTRFRSRALQFPGILSGCIIDWYLPWTHEALVAVSEKFIEDVQVPIATTVSTTSSHNATPSSYAPLTPSLRTSLANFMSRVHFITEEHAAEYYHLNKRRIYFTPKSFISYIHSFRKLYSKKLDELQKQYARLTSGLGKLIQAESDIIALEHQLSHRERDLNKASSELDILMNEITINKALAQTKSIEMTAVRNRMVETARTIEADRRDAEKDLASAQPLMYAAQRALETISQKDINLLKSLLKPHNLIERVFDAILILNRREVRPVEMDDRFGHLQVSTGPASGNSASKAAKDFPRFQTSWNISISMLRDKHFLDLLVKFPKHALDDETMELLQPYLSQVDFTPESATQVSSWVAGLMTWVISMRKYWSIYKFVQPKRIRLDEQKELVEIAETKLIVAEREMIEYQTDFERITIKYDESVATKERLERDMNTTLSKIRSARALLAGLATEQARWSIESRAHMGVLSRLLGNTLLAQSFLSKAGPFNQQFRVRLMQRWMKELMNVSGGNGTDGAGLLLSPSHSSSNNNASGNRRASGTFTNLLASALDSNSNNINTSTSTTTVPFDSSLNVCDFLSSENEIGAWTNLQGLPVDRHSIENAVILTRSSRFPLLIDPQGQGKNWFQQKWSPVPQSIKSARSSARNSLVLKKGGNGAHGPVAALTSALSETAVKSSASSSSRDLVICSANDPLMRVKLERSLEYGKIFILSDLDETIPNLLTNVLDRILMKRGKTYTVSIGGIDINFHSDFYLCLCTKLPNPHYSPEISASTLIIDFTVTHHGLESQLLERVIMLEKKELEEQRVSVLKDIQIYRETRLVLEDDLLVRLSEHQGDLLSDTGLIDVLNATKKTSEEMTEKMMNSRLSEKNINAARDEYRLIAIRGSILFFILADMSKVNHMYQSSLTHFMSMFDEGLSAAEKSTVVQKRVKSIVESTTYSVYKHVVRGLFRSDTMMFQLLLAVKVDMQRGVVKQSEFELLLKGSMMNVKYGSQQQQQQGDDTKSSTGGSEAGGGGHSSSLLSSSTPPNRFPRLLTHDMWCGALALSEMSFFSSHNSSHSSSLHHSSSSSHKHCDLLLSFEKYEMYWLHWLHSEQPEVLHVPDTQMEERMDSFQRLCLIRCLRPDRTMLAAMKYIQTSIGERFVSPPTMQLDDIVRDSNSVTPIIFLLSTGADPSQSIRETAQRWNTELHTISMGQGQEIRARALVKKLTSSESQGGWLLLQNAHLSLPFMVELQALLTSLEVAAGGSGMSHVSSASSAASSLLNGGDDSNHNISTSSSSSSTRNRSFRLWITTQPCTEFPIVFLQSAIKLTSETPQGMKHGLSRQYGSLGQNILEAVDRPEWQPLLYAICFLHCAVIERRKFGSIGWQHAYEFNSSDSHASIEFAKKFLYSEDARRPLRWEAVRYMIADIMYGGRIIDDWDRLCMNAITDQWLTREIVPIVPVGGTNGTSALSESAQPRFEFAPNYPMPQGLTKIRDYLSFIDTLPMVDPPELLGLASNADLIYRNAEVQHVCKTIWSIQPKENSSASISSSSSSSSATAAAATGSSSDAASSQRESRLNLRIASLLADWPPEFDMLRVEQQIARLETIAGMKQQQQQQAMQMQHESGATAGVEEEINATAASAASPSTASSSSASTSSPPIIQASNPLNVCLRQEIDRMQIVLVTVRKHLLDLQLTLAGSILLTPELELILDALHLDIVPQEWEDITWKNSAGTLTSWFHDMYGIVSQLSSWLKYGQPKVFSLSCLFNPKGFLTAVKQVVARANRQWALDDMELIATVTKYQSKDQIKARPEDGGVYVSGWFLDGAAWDPKRQRLIECVGSLTRRCQMPVIHVTARSSLNSSPFGYVCPVYRLTARTDTNFIMTIALASDMRSAHWTRRGVAIICAPT